MDDRHFFDLGPWTVFPDLGPWTYLGFSVLIWGTSSVSFLISKPARFSTSGGSWAIIVATSCVTLLAPAPLPPVLTMVILSVFDRGSAIARAISGRAWSMSWATAA